MNSVSTIMHLIPQIWRQATATQSVAITASGAHGMDASALWAPGDGNVLVMADAGNDYEAAADHYDVSIRNGAITVATD